MPKPVARRVASPQRKPSAKQWIPVRDAVRIVPLHYPRPSYSVDQLAAAQALTAPNDLYDGKLHFAPANARLSYRGGPLLTRPQVYAIYWGASWQTSPSARTLMRGLDQFFGDILVRAEGEVCHDAPQ